MLQRSAYHFDDDVSGIGYLGQHGNVAVEVAHPPDLGDEPDDPEIELTVTKGMRKTTIRLHLTVALGVAEAIHKLSHEINERFGKPEPASDPREH